MAKRELDTRQERFVAAYVGAAKGNATRAAELAEYPAPRQAGSRLLSNVVIQARLAEARAAIHDEGIANLQNRIDAYNDRWRKLQLVIAARGVDLAGEVAGGETGLLVRTPMLVKTYAATEDEDGAIISTPASQIVYTYAVDTGTLKELRELERQAAIEAGQWEEPGKGENIGVRVLVGVNIDAL